MKSAYINKNTAELRDWLRSIGMLPIDYPETDTLYIFFSMSKADFIKNMESSFLL